MSAWPELDWIPYPEAESWRMLWTRVSALFDTWEAEGRDGGVVVSHGHAMTCLINRFLGLTTDALLARLMYDLRPCSLTHLSTDPDGSRRVVRLNDVGHLVET
jgi:probable phosphoglycerate mutase